MSRLAVQISETATVALINTTAGQNDKTVVLPACRSGKIIYIADQSGNASSKPVWISSSGVGASIIGSPIFGPSNLPVINQNFGAMGFVASGTNWFTLFNTGGTSEFRSISTNSAFVRTLSTASAFGEFTGKFSGDGSSLTGLPSPALPTVVFHMSNNYNYAFGDWANVTPDLSICNSTGPSFCTLLDPPTRIRFTTAGLYNVTYHTGGTLCDFFDSVVWMEYYLSNNTLTATLPGAGGQACAGASRTHTLRISNANDYLMPQFRAGTSFWSVDLSNYHFVQWSITRLGN